MNAEKAGLKIAGIVYAMCSSAIEKSLESLAGVEQAQVNLATKTDLGSKILLGSSRISSGPLPINGMPVPLAAGVLYPIFRITFRPELAGLAMALSSVSVVSLLLKRYILSARSISRNRG